MPNPLALERLVATTAMGFALGWVRRRTGSVLPGTLLHALHNASATLISYYSTRLAGAGLGQDPTTHLPTTWLIASAILLTCGLLAVWKGSSQPSRIEGVSTSSQDLEDAPTDPV
jgi:ABC-2 type transport system permease protein/sodium transport system permease protein